MDRLIGSIKPHPPFDFDLTVSYHTYFQSRYGTDRMEDGAYHRLLDLGDKLILASVRSVGTTGAPELALKLRGDRLTQDDAQRATRRVAWLLGTDQDLAPFYASIDTDPVMSEVVERFYGLHLPHTGTIFEALVLGVLGQHIATNVARIIRTLIIETFGSRAEFNGKTYYAFPRPEAIWASSPDELRTMKLTQRKSEYVHGIAGAALDSAVGLESVAELPDKEIVERLTALRGVGQWTAQWALIRAVGRPDALPLGDLAVRRVVSRLFFDGAEVTDAQVEELARRWSPYRTYATVYLFTALRGGMV